MNRLKNIVCAAGFAAMTCILGGCSLMYDNYIYQNGDKYVAGDREIADRIDTIDVNYLSGTVRVEGTDSGIVSVRETANVQLDDKKKVHTWVDGTTLYVRYCTSGKNLQLSGIEKDLVIEVPQSVDMSNVRIDVSSADTTCRNIRTDNLDIDASSAWIIADCEAKDIRLEASSGDITLSQHGNSDSVKLEVSSGNIIATVENAADMNVGSSSGSLTVEADNLRSFKSEASSGRTQLTFKNAPENTDIEASSGDVTIYVPADSDLAVDADASSGDFSYDLPFSYDGSKYICGSGRNRMDIETSSGDIELKVL